MFLEKPMEVVFWEGLPWEELHVRVSDVGNKADYSILYFLGIF